MNNIKIEVNTKDVLKKFASLNSKQQAKVYRQATQKALQPLVKETKKNLKQDFGKKASQKDKYGNSLISGVKMKIYKNGNGGNVNILSNFKLKWFELGTAIRKTRKGWARGKIKALNFFKKSRDKLEKEILSNLDAYISNSIFKTWNKK